VRRLPPTNLDRLLMVEHRMVNDAGVAMERAHGLKSVHETDDETYGITMRVNSRSVFLGYKYAGQQMIQRDPQPSGDWGWIINTPSIAGLVGLAGCVSYTASKGSVVQMTKAVALNYAPNRIHCNAVCPGCGSVVNARRQELTGISHKYGNDQAVDR